jgi:DNA helicase II / ATP-dependent DNA helicase PcrA
MKSEQFDHLDSRQRRVVMHRIIDGHVKVGGPLWVQGSSGTGKSNTLAHCVVNLVGHGANYDRFLIIAASPSAATVLHKRIHKMLTTAGLNGVNLGAPTVGTFLTVAERLVRAQSKANRFDPSWTLLSRNGALSLMNSVRYTLGLHTRFPSRETCYAILTHIVNSQLRLEEVVQRCFPQHMHQLLNLQAVFNGYHDLKNERRSYDLNDVLIRFSEMLDDQVTAEAIGRKFRYVWVDEFQRSSQLQRSILRKLKPSGSGVTVFTESSSLGPLPLHDGEMFSKPTQRIILKRNYRSSPAILAAADAVISVGRDEPVEPLIAVRTGGGKPRLVCAPDDANQAVFIADEIERNVAGGQRYKQHAVLFSVASHSAALEAEFVRRSIPFAKLCGPRLDDIASPKNFLALLEWIQQPTHRTAGLRVLAKLTTLSSRQQLEVFNWINGSPAPTARCPVPLSQREAPAVSDLVELITSGAQLSWKDRLVAAFDWYQANLWDNQLDDRHSEIVHLFLFAWTHRSQRQFHRAMALDAPIHVQQNDAADSRSYDFVTLSTFQNCEGEWRSLYILNAVVNGMPSVSAERADKAEAGRTLFYSAMMRTKRDLVLMVRNQLASMTQGAATQRSPFLPDDLLNHFEVVPMQELDRRRR